MNNTKWVGDLVTNFPSKYNEVIAPYALLSAEKQLEVAEHLWMLMEEVLFQDVLERGLSLLTNNPFRNFKGNPYEPNNKRYL